ncbi:hypothetical protein SAMN04487983_105524 [Streptomyces sp. yr375]|nr:hypothetical protein SAMN04487983_105524 [Streptomyces sp. yr375]
MNKPSPNPANDPQDAVQGAQGVSVGVLKVAARQGVRNALRSNPPQGDGRYPVAWLEIRPPRRSGGTPTATSQCLCGWDRSAVGHTRVLALIEAHTAHRDACPLRHPQEGRAAA